MSATADSHADHASNRWYGVYAGRVRDNLDPDGLGRVKVALRQAAKGEKVEAWARLATLMAGPGRGTWFLPEVDDEVLVAFEGGEPSRPYVVGSLWNESQPPPEPAGSGSDRKVIRSRNGVTVTLEDRDGQDSFTVETSGGQRLTLTDAAGGAVDIADAAGNTVTLRTSGMSLTSSAKVTIVASQVEIAAGMLKVDAGMATFSGVVKADTVITNSVVASSYTPGTGNIW